MVGSAVPVREGPTQSLMGHLVLSSLHLCDVHIYQREEIQVTFLPFQSSPLDQCAFYLSNLLVNINIDIDIDIEINIVIEQKE